MKILFAPSESKRSGGEAKFKLEALLFEPLYPYRKKLLHTYTNIIQKGDIKELSELFGLKKESDILKYKKDIFHEPAMKSIQRYNGVAYEYLNYNHLSSQSQLFLDEHTIIFSNLFGPIRADDFIPEYKLKQGAVVGEIKVEKFYNEHASGLMEDYLVSEEILDLRAGFYEKFYKPAKTYTTLKFVKNGKVLSHWAKAYRGIVLREIAKARVSSIEEFMKLPIEGLQISEIQTRKNKTEIIYNIEN